MKLTINLTSFSHVIGNSHESNSIFGFYRTRSEIIRAVTSGWCQSFGTYGSCLSSTKRSQSDDLIRVYTLEKRRKVVAVGAKTKKNGADKKTRVVVRRAHWVARVYDIPTSLLKIAKLKVVQHPRHFELVHA